MPASSTTSAQIETHMKIVNLPIGPGEAREPFTGELVYGLGFEATVMVGIGGGIGKIGNDSNPHNPNGTWSINQTHSISYVKDGVEQIPAKSDTDVSKRSFFNYNSKGNYSSIRYRDHPGAVIGKFKTWSSTQRFSITASRDGKQYCSVSFQLDIFVDGGEKYVRWRRR